MNISTIKSQKQCWLKNIGYMVIQPDSVYVKPENIQSIGFLLVLEVGSPGSRCWQVWFPLGSLFGLQRAAFSLCPLKTLLQSCFSYSFTTVITNPAKQAQILFQFYIHKQTLRVIISVWQNQDFRLVALNTELVLTTRCILLKLDFSLFTFGIT